VPNPIQTRTLFAELIAELSRAAQLLVTGGYAESEIAELEELCLLICGDLRIKHGVAPRGAPARQTAPLTLLHDASTPGT
jgi:hypothetical protein